MKKTLLFGLLFVYHLAGSQNLLPSIGLFSPPSDTDPICWFPYYNDPDGSFNAPGPEVGDTVPDFTLYDRAGNAINLANELQAGKYVLLVAGSWTCPVYRNKIAEINNIVQNYSVDVSVYVIYELEAHPSTDTSIYFGFVNPGAQNTSSGILYPQPDTYGERKIMVDVMNDSMMILAPILLDGPCNEYLSYFGPAPNNAYLIDTNGIIVVKHGWFDKYPRDMSNDIDSVLGQSGGNPPGTNGTFTFQMATDTIASGNPGDILFVEGNFTNTHPTDDVIISISRTQNNMPDQSWTSSMCINACLSPSVSNYTLQIPAGYVQHFIFYFFTGSSAMGDAGVEFINVNNTSNNYSFHYYAYTNGAIGVNENNATENFNVYPNPGSGMLLFTLPVLSIEVTDINGKKLKTEKFSTAQNQTDISGIPAGIYFVRVETEAGLIFTSRIIKIW